MKKRIIALLLAIALLCSVCALGASAATEVKTACGGDCDHVPSIVIPGIGQSRVMLLNDDGTYKLDKDGHDINCFPGYFDVGAIVRRVLVPALLSIATQQDIGFSKAVADAVENAFYMNKSDNNGKCTGPVKLENYPYSLAECTQEEKDYIYGCIPLQSFAEIAGEDHLYYFAYNSFGNNADIVEELYQFIQQVKAETGHDKVNIVPISMGGTLANGLLEYHPEVINDLHRVVYVVPALDGSSIVGDVYNKRLTFLDPDYLYHGFLEGLMDAETAAMIETLVRILPDRLLLKALDVTVDRLLTEVFANCTMLWALCPSADYESAAAALLSAPEKAVIKAQTDRYYQAQKNSHANIQKLLDAGVSVFNVVDYDFPLYNVGASWNLENADGVIDLNSTGMGVYSANCGETLPEGYTQQNTHCTNPDHNHISPDNVVDASTGLLPDTTFYFDGQGHESTGRNDVIMKLATALLADDRITDVYSDPNFPQFNAARDTKGLINGDLPAAKAVDQSKLSPEDAAELQAAIDEAEAMVADTVVDPARTDAAKARLNAILVKIGVREAPKEEKESTFFIGIADGLYKAFGTAGFSQMPMVGIQRLFAALIALVKK